MAQSELAHGFDQMVGLVSVHGYGTSVLNCTEATTPRAATPEDEKGRSAPLEALSDVGAFGFLTNRGQGETVQHGLHLLPDLGGERPALEPSLSACFPLYAEVVWAQSLSGVSRKGHVGRLSRDARVNGRCTDSLTDRGNTI